MATIDDDQKFSRVHPDCINASNPYHECVEYCFRRIAETQATRVAADVRRDDSVAEVVGGSSPGSEKQEDDATREEKDEQQKKTDETSIDADSYSRLTPTQKKLFDLRLKLNAARKANQAEIVAEKKRSEGTVEPRGVSKQKWFEEKQKRLGKQLELNGLDAKKAYMLDTQELAESKYKKWEKKPAPFGWDVFNQRSLYNAYKKRTKHIPYTVDDYLKAKESDPDFFRDGTSLEYGKDTPIPQENIDRMVAELEDRDRKRKAFSRRRKFHEEKDVDSINDRNEHFNKKIERAFGKYTVEIKNNLERGTALPD